MLRWFACIIFIILFSYNNICEGAAIDVGVVPIDRNAPLSSRTIINEGNPANLTGTIDHIDVWFSSSGSTSDYAAFTSTGTDEFSTNGTATGLTHSTGDNNFDAPGDFTAFDITSGDYIGIYTTDNPDSEIFGSFPGIWHILSDEIPTTTTTFTHRVNSVLSLYATGVTASSVQLPQVIIIND